MNKCFQKRARSNTIYMSGCNLSPTYILVFSGASSGMVRRGIKHNKKVRYFVLRSKNVVMGNIITVNNVLSCQWH